MVLHSYQKRTNRLYIGLQIHGKAIERESSFHFLGIHIENPRKWQAHKDTMEHKINKYLYEVDYNRVSICICQC